MTPEERQIVGEWFSVGDWTFEGQPINVDDMNAVVGHAVEAALAASEAARQQAERERDEEADRASGWKSAAENDRAHYLAMTARAERLETALRALMRTDEHAPGCPGDQFHDRSEHDCEAIRTCAEARAAIRASGPPGTLTP